MREKVEAVDYRYFPEPNIPRIKIEESLIEKLKGEIPLLPYQRKKLYLKEYDLNEYDANVLIKDKELSDFYQECVKISIDPKIACNYITTIILSYLNKDNLKITDLFITPSMLKFIIDKQNNNEISSKQAKEIISGVIENKVSPEKLIKDLNIVQNSNQDELLSIINGILSTNESQIIDYFAGRTNLFDYFVGQVMKITKGQANPSLTKELLTIELEKHKKN